MLSGGIDSVAMVYLLLKQGERLYIHHVEIDNEENRSVVENVAVKNVLAYFDSVGLTNYEYSSSKLSCPTINNKFLYDSDVTNLFAGFICNANPKIKSVAMGVNKEDMRNVGSVRIDRANKLLKLFADVEKLYPIKDYSKKDLYDLLPQELKDTFWSCRTPVYENNIAKPCNSCFTCGQMKQMGITQNSLILNQLVV
jgi:7-cyano-7-deazaguanine synthase in queuosine biosynthesis